MWIYLLQCDFITDNCHFFSHNSRFISHIWHFVLIIMTWSLTAGVFSFIILIILYSISQLLLSDLVSLLGGAQPVHVTCLIKTFFTCMTRWAGFHKYFSSQSVLYWETFLWILMWWMPKSSAERKGDWKQVKGGEWDNPF